MLFVGTSIIHPSTEGVFLLCNILDLLIYSNKYKQGVGTGSCNLIFTKSGYNSTNTQVGMGMENYQSQLSTAFVSGNVDFR